VRTEDQRLRSVFVLPGMDCPAEEHLVRLALADVDEVTSLTFDLGARRLEAVHVGPAGALLGALEPLGMGATLETSAAVAADAPADPEQHAPRGPAERAALWAVLAINATMFVVELVAGILAQSTGLLADSVDMLADASIYAIALLAVGRDRTRQHRAARASGWLQLGLAGLVLLEVLRRAAPPAAPGGAPRLARHRRGGEHMRASWIFTTNDVLANLGVIVAGVLVWVTGSAVPDLIIGTAIAVLVASGAWRILRIR
jgi:Co/Zn/Cd efflux system component